MIDLKDVEKYLHQHIPISNDMGIQVMAYDGSSVRLSAPLSPNLNHRNTTFGGSVSALGILSSWTLLHIKMRETQQSVWLVIQKSEMNFMHGSVCRNRIFGNDLPEH